MQSHLRIALSNADEQLTINPNGFLLQRIDATNVMTHNTRTILKCHCLLTSYVGMLPALAYYHSQIIPHPSALPALS